MSIFDEYMSIALEADDDDDTDTGAPDNGKEEVVDAGDITKDTEDMKKGMREFSDEDDKATDNDTDAENEDNPDSDDNDDTNEDDEGNPPPSDDMGTTDTTETEENKTDDAFQDKKTLRDNMALLLDTISSSIDMMDGYSSEISYGENKLFNAIRNNLRSCKDILFETLTGDLSKVEYVTLMRKYVSSLNVYDICINMLERYFNIKHQNEDKSKQRTRIKYETEKKK